MREEKADREMSAGGTHESGHAIQHNEQVVSEAVAPPSDDLSRHPNRHHHQSANTDPLWEFTPHNRPLLPVESDDYQFSIRTKQRGLHPLTTPFIASPFHNGRNTERN